jgi:quercetin 2,3-dioxygenase
MSTVISSVATDRARSVERVVSGQATSDGAGVRLTRVLTQDLQQRLDPYLMLDAFRTDDPEDYIAGFPDHPHRGFETVTYMLAGRLRHRDSAGHEGLLTAGGVQWMVAGRGIVHSEMPEQEDGLMEGFQLWLNLPARDKMTRASYRDIAPSTVPEVALAGGVRVRVIAGESHGTRGAVTRPVTEPLYLDIELPAGTSFRQSVPADHNAFAYVFRGEARIGDAGTPVEAGRMALLATDGVSTEVRIDAPHGARALLIAGRPLREPIVQYGPFVMNSPQEIRQAFTDFHAGSFGQDVRRDA